MHETGTCSPPMGGAEGGDAVRRTFDSFMAALRSGAETAIDCPRASSACMFSIDFCVAACLTVSNMADARGGVRIPTFCDTRVPGWVGSGTDAVIVSGSRVADIGGLYDTLMSRGCRIHVIAPAGDLHDRAMADGAETITIPEDLDSSETVAFSIGSLCSMMSSMSLIDSESELDSVLSGCSSSSLCGAIPAGDIIGVYSTSDVSACSKRWSDLITEICGTPAFRGELPEYDHNELVGWSDPNLHSGGLRMVVLRSEEDGSMVSIIVKHMLEVLSENGRNVVEIDIGAGSTLMRNVRGMIQADICIRRKRWQTSL